MCGIPSSLGNNRECHSQWINERNAEGMEYKSYHVATDQSMCYFFNVTDTIIAIIIITTNLNIRS
jgi:hypothetical protein